jgi:hypothetical protein
MGVAVDRHRSSSDGVENFVSKAGGNRDVVGGAGFVVCNNSVGEFGGITGFGGDVTGSVDGDDGIAEILLGRFEQGDEAMLCSGIHVVDGCVSFLMTQVVVSKGEVVVSEGEML